ncbi:MAG TPA: DUF2970 domain-containing protein [Burkholderiales bacterium]|nr:DUF2970 domain-containing protein [Burkholderiales bacterium]
MAAVGRKDRETGGALRAFRAVFSAFTGIGRGNALRDDLAMLRPWQVIAAGLICAAVFVTVIVTLVRNIAT